MGEGLATRRFDIVRPVGAGGMGIVYEARERTTGERVAIKTLQEFDGHALYRLKNEFRQLQGILHDNLIRLRELVAEDDTWFLVMDFVDGLDVVTHVRGGDPASLASTVRMAPLAMKRTRSAPAATDADLDHGAVRAIIAGMAAGLHTLHEAGYVHRDIKPSNILVRPDGVPVILDFGLVAHQVGVDSTEGSLVGTVPYMAPEQALGHRATPAVDCYGLGVVVFEMLTGRWPHDGGLAEMITGKQTIDPPLVSALAPATPADLDRLCTELLDRDPLRRPTALDVAQRFTAAAAATPPPHPRRGVTRSGSLGVGFVGRRRELGQLSDLMAHTRGGVAGAVWIRGESGVGKSALLRRFADQIGAEYDDAVVLQTRCHQHEQVPFKAVDGIVDALSTFLRGLHPEDAASLLPRHASFLRVAFPVLARVDAIARAPYPVRPVQDPQERRQRAFASLRDLLGRVADRHPLVLIIDDLQWGDDDSAQLLQEVLRPPDAPPLLLVLASRDDDRATELVVILEVLEGPVQRIDLGALDATESTELARRLLSVAGLGSRASATAIGDEADGNPLMVHELVRHAASSVQTPHSPRLDDAIRMRVATLSAAAQHALRMLCLAGAPLTMDVLGLASGLPAVELARAVAVLVAESLVRSSGAARDALEPYHDRVREAIVAAMAPADRIDRHRQLAATLESTPLATSRPELLLLHFQACGRCELAAEYAERAARQASDGLAFGRAAELLELALVLDPRDPDSERTRRIALAEAEARAGRVLDAAHSFLTASAGAERHLSFQLKSQAVEQLLRGGALERGRELAAEVLAPLGIRIPRGPRRAAVDMLVQRCLLRLRGSGFSPRPVEQLAAAELEVIDILWSISSAFAFADPMVSRALAVRCTRRALRSGDARRIALALGTEASYRALAGARARDVTARYLAQGLSVAAACGSPYALGFVTGSVGLAHFMRGEFAEALTDFEHAIDILRSEVTDARWEVDVAEIYRTVCLLWLGRLRELDGVVSGLLAEAVHSGDQYLTIGLRAWRSNLLWLVRDQPVEARRHIEDAQALTSSSHRGFGMFDFLYGLGLANIDLYEGSAEAAWQRADGIWPLLRRSRLLGVESLNTEAVGLRMRAAIALAVRSSPDDRRSLLRVASAMASTLRGTPVRDALGSLGALQVTCAAGAAVSAGAPTRVIAQLDGASVALYAAAARLRVGNDDQVDAGAAFLARERVVDARALAAVLVPVAIVRAGDGLPASM